MTGTDIRRTIADRLYALLLLAYPVEFRDRFGAGMRYAFAEDLQAARRTGLVPWLRFWMSASVDTVRSGLAERSESESHRRRERVPLKSRVTVDWRDAWRSLRATPMVTAVAVLSLALGIGANVALFSIFNGLMLKRLPVPEADRLALLEDGSWTNPIWEQIRAAQDRIADGGFAWSVERFNLAATGQADPVDGIYASGRMFEVLGVSAIRGRTFTVADDVRTGGPAGPVAVISHRLWQRRFGAADDAIGRTLTINGATYSIVGVTPEGFFGPDVGRSADVMVPLGTEAIVRGADSALDRRSSWWLNIMLRRQRGQSLEALTNAVRGLQPQIRAATLPQGEGNRDSAYLVDPFVLASAVSGRSTLRTRYQQPLTTLMGVVALVLLIACANIANLQLGRATARRRDLGLRLALGASRMRLSRQLIAESLMLAGAGATIGLLLAQWSSRALVSQISPAGNPLFLDTGIDWRVFVFTIGVSAMAALLFGIAPAMMVNRLSLNDALKEHGRAPIGERRALFRHGLVVVQVALSLVLVIAASLLGRTFLSLSNRHAGFERDRVLLAAATVTQPPEQRLATFERLREAAAAVPGVSAAAFSYTTPVGRAGWNTMILIPGSTAGRRERMSWINAVSPGWFGVYGMRIVAGRDFDHRDRPGAPLAAVVNQAFARKYLAPGDPIGQRFADEQPSGTGDGYVVVGVVEDSIYRSLRSPMDPIIFRAAAQWEDPGRSITLSIRSAGARPAALVAAVSEALARTEPAASTAFSTLASQVDASLIQERVLATLSGFFGALALLLASLGLYGVTSYSVNRRRSEIGIRMALGAEPFDVVRMVLTRVSVLVTLGLIVGTATAVWASRYVASLLYGFTPTDPATFAGAALVLTVVAAIAGWLPARRAARIDPTIVLRDA